MNAILRHDDEARRRELFVRTYSVIPLQTSGGLIEWVPNLITFRRALLPLTLEKSPPTAINAAMAHTKKPKDKDKLTDSDRLAMFRNLLDTYPVVMSEWFRYDFMSIIVSGKYGFMQRHHLYTLFYVFRRTFTDPCGWYAARLAFTHTSAVMSMIGFVLGLGDRHGENILLDAHSGDVLHVDFNMLFNKGEDLEIPEVRIGSL
jgi:serine/threonine-protein kinase ATR